MKNTPLRVSRTLPPDMAGYLVLGLGLACCCKAKGMAWTYSAPPRPAGTDRRRRGGFALLEKECLIKYCRRDGTVYVVLVQVVFV